MNQNQLHAGHVALVTGAAGGIGQAVVRRLAAGGASVALVDADARVEGVAKQLKGEFPDVDLRGYATDITDTEKVRQLARSVEDDFGRLDSVALVAGVVQTAAPIAQLGRAEWDRVLGVNLTGPYEMTHALSPLLARDGGGSITAVSSWWGRSGHAYFAAYCAAKAGLIVFVQAVAAELAPTVRVNTICPGNINTRMHQEALRSEAEERGVSYEDIKASEWAKIPLGKAGEPEDIAEAIYFLSSPAASYITGASLDVNGGVVFH
ncbi:SDR family NAD(P)-dependent oxidoreductase [Sinomonas sp. ASV486]|uniref:SDR family NAD(P)-dependent oxidoreductase n=1 Tax=Sinomonas sp. ASV486 TaxID=3051170 RepID=UPI0027DB3D31|nr:SDR family NAD(P)-dependent oxidoreductase [Sinomonas sp. ASV486]MDQ4490810.1 SDR family NAD(P)-dependent oxidoreductase [Sinomonas sp. ASV486]